MTSAGPGSIGGQSEDGAEIMKKASIDTEHEHVAVGEVDELDDAVDEV